MTAVSSELSAISDPAIVVSLSTTRRESAIRRRGKSSKEDAFATEVVTHGRCWSTTSAFDALFHSPFTLVSQFSCQIPSHCSTIPMMTIAFSSKQWRRMSDHKASVGILAKDLNNENITQCSWFVVYVHSHDDLESKDRSSLF